MNRKQIIRNLRAKNIAFDVNDSTADLNALLVGAQNKISKSFNFAGGRGKISIAFNAADDQPAEVMICEEIGRDPWSGEGVCLKDIQTALNEVTPKTRPLNFLVNSPGGSVSEGVSIRNYLTQWAGRITETIIGIAASTASWCIPADEVRAYKSSQMFLHRSWGMVVGNSDDMRGAINFLETTDGQIAQMLADQSEATPEEMMDLMKSETLLTGQQALDLGLVDVLIDGEAQNQFTTEQINSMKQRLAALNTLRPANAGSAAPSLRSAPGNPADAGRAKSQTDQNQTQDTIMNKTEMLALLNKWGVTVPKDATDEQIKNLVEAGKPAAAPAAPAANDDIVKLQNQVKTLTDANNEARRGRIATEIDALITDDKLAQNEREDAIELAMDATTGEKYLKSLKNRQPQRPGSEPVGTMPNVEGVGDSIKDVTTFVMKNGPDFRAQFLGTQNATKEITDNVRKEFAAKQLAVAKIIAKNLKNILHAWNTNTISSDLQRQVILQVPLLTAFKRRIEAINGFSFVANNIPLEGSAAKVEVAYYPLQTAASTAFNGTYSAGNTAVESREVLITNRLYQMFSFTSSELRRLPYVNWEQLATQNGEKLGYDVFAAIVAGAITAANFGAAVLTVAAPQFSADNIADLWEVATGLNWPDDGRSLTLNHTYKTPLLKDPTFKSALAYGSADPIRKAMIKEAYDFENIYTVPNLTSVGPAGENLVGWINHKSAVLAATSPIMPTEDVRAVMTRYDVVTDPDTGLSVEYRRWGSPDTDKTNEVVECNFGYGKGVDAALRRIATP